MANHVYFNITVEGLDAGCKALERAMPVETVERKMYDDTMRTFKEIIDVDKLPMYENCGQEYDEDGNQTNWYDWGCTNVGAKWISFDDFELTPDGYISGHSAWSHPYPMCEKLCEFIANMTNKEIDIRMTYEDEFRNFFGVDHFYSVWSEEDECWYTDHSENYYDHSDLNDIVREKFGDQIDEDDFDWWDTCKTVEGEELSAGEYADEVIYNFFDCEELVAV